MSARQFAAAVSEALGGLQIVPLWGVDGGRCRCRDGAACSSPGKHPRHKWKGQPSRLPDPGDNYALVLGRYIVVDVDDRDVLARLDTVLGFTLPDTWAVDTARGRHLWFVHTEPCATRLGAFDKVDLKSGNTYVVGPGSVSATGAMYEPVNGLPIAPAPAALVAACGRIGTLSVMSLKVPDVTSRFAWPMVEQHVEEMRSAPLRNNALLRLTCIMLRAGVFGEDALDALASAAEQSGLSRAEVRRTMESARRLVGGES